MINNGLGVKSENGNGGNEVKLCNVNQYLGERYSQVLKVRIRNVQIDLSLLQLKIFIAT